MLNLGLMFEIFFKEVEEVYVTESAITEPNLIIWNNSVITRPTWSQSSGGNTGSNDQPIAPTYKQPG